MSDKTGPGPEGVLSRMAEVMAQVDRIPKRGRNDFHGYDYVLEADLVEHLRPLMLDAGLVMVPSQGERLTRQVPTSSGETTVTEILHRFRIYDTDTGGHVELSVWGAGADGQDKGPYKAFTGAQKYALMKAFMVATGDDPEHDQGYSPPKREQSQRGRSQQRSGADTKLSCPDCGGPVWDNTDDPKAAANGGKRPNFKCRDQDGCDWATWDNRSEVWPEDAPLDIGEAKRAIFAKLGEWIADPEMRRRYLRAYAKDRVDQDDDPGEWDLLACQRALSDLEKRGMEALGHLEPDRGEEQPTLV